MGEKRRLAAEADDDPEPEPTRVDRTDIEDARADNREAVLGEEPPPAPEMAAPEMAAPEVVAAAEPLPSEAPMPEPVAAEAQPAEMAADRIEGPLEEAPPAAPTEAPQPQQPP